MGYNKCDLYTYDQSRMKRVINTVNRPIHAVKGASKPLPEQHAVTPGHVHRHYEGNAVISNG